MIGLYFTLIYTKTMFLNKKIKFINKMLPLPSGIFCFARFKF